MLILGLDPGLTRCGVGVVELVHPKSLVFKAVTVLRSDASEELPERLRGIGSALSMILDEHEPDVISLERVFAQHNLSTVMGTAQISGVVMYLAAQRGIPVCMYTPSEVKAAVTGYGSADKQQVTSMVTKILRLDAPPKPADAADALALAIAHGWRAMQSGASRQSGEGEKTPAQLAWLAAERRSKR